MADLKMFTLAERMFCFLRCLIGHLATISRRTVQRQIRNNAGHDP